MTWYYGYRYKWKYASRLARQHNFYDDNISVTDERAIAYLRRALNGRAHFRIARDYRGKLIISFHKTEVKGDLDRLRAHPGLMRMVARVFFGEEREPRWYTDDEGYRPSKEDPESSDDERLPIEKDTSGFYAKPPYELIAVDEPGDGGNKRLIYTYKAPPYLSHSSSTNGSDNGSSSEHSRTKARRAGLKGKKPKILSAGKARKCRAKRH